MTYSLLSPTRAGQPDPAQQEAEGVVKAALDALTEHIAILNEDGTIIHVNQAWREFGELNHYPDSSYGIGQNYLAVCEKSARAAQDAALVANGIRAVMRRESGEFYLEYPCHSPTERRWYVVRVTCFSWYGAIRVIVAHQNITAVKQVQVELADSKRRLEAILENLADGVITFDQTGRIESINSAGAHIFGYEPDEILGEKVTRLIPALAGDWLAASLPDELEGQRKDASTVPIYFAVNQLELDGQRLFTATVQDLSERKYLESQLWDKERLNIALEQERELRDLKNRFISMMSHELRTPLAAIKLANSMLRQYGDRATEDEKRESYDTIDQQVAYLTELVGDVMTISRADFTGAEFEAELVDLETYTRNIVEEMQLAYQAHNRLRFTGVNQRVEARVDPKLLRRALTNLLTNAMKYSPEDKPIQVCLETDEQEAVIQVSDQGIGIPAEDLKHLFEPFHRAGNVGKIQGTGLGLAIAKQAIELHGGTITVESVVGEGTTFTVRLPLH